MREIKFRARLNQKGSEHAQLAQWQYFTLEEAFYHHGLWELIDPETVGQFTGLHDKNGKEIWEGDRVRREVCSPDDMAHGIYGYTGIVKWERGKFIIECDEDNSFYDHMGDLFSWDELEVIGNIYENPELIGESK